MPIIWRGKRSKENISCTRTPPESENMEERHRRRQHRQLSFKSFVSHTFAMIMGALFLLLWQALHSIEQNAFSPSIGSNANSSDRSSSVLTKSIPCTGKYDVLPMMVLEHEISPADLRIIITEAQTRILFNSSLYTGPFHIYYPEQRSYVGDYLKREVSDLHVQIHSVQNTSDRQKALLSPNLWLNMQLITEKVLCVDISSVLCSRPTYPVAWFVPQFDWIGAAWSWAEDLNSRHNKGGNGALSIRSPSHMLQILLHQQHESGNEDMWFVSKLRDWEESGEIRNGVPPPKLPSHHEQQLFAVEVVPSPQGHTPVGIYHLMIVMDYTNRNRMIESCPEAKRLFPPLHERTCVKLECPRNMSYNLFEWETRMKQSDFDKNTETCSIYHHPVAKSWNLTASDK